MNNEAKTRRLTKSGVLGKGKTKVMSYKNIEEVWATYAAKDAMKGKGKRSRKRKSALEETDELEPEVAQVIEAPKPFKALVARMIWDCRTKKEESFVFYLVRIGV